MTSPAPNAIRTIVPSQNTAPVHEFACLYTHDLRRKQKRWQDGFLKFHTFNKRAMVYDQSRNHIGDTHWKKGDELQEGDELTLENGVIVEVAEPKSITQTDLTPILQKRPREGVAENGMALRNPRLPVPGVRSSGIRSSAVSQSLNRPLSAVLGTPKGPLGKAQLPHTSPFEERKANQAKDWAATERAAKRQRVAEVGQVWNAAKEIRTPVPKSRVQQYAIGRAAMAPPLLERQTSLTPRGYSRIVPQDNVIDITSDVEEPMSDVTLPNTPPNFSHHALFAHGKESQRPIQRPAPKVTAAGHESRSRKGLHERPLACSPSPPVSKTSKVTGVQEATVAGRKAPDGAETPSDGRTPSPQRKTLKLRAGPRKKWLFCQGVPAPQDSGASAALNSRGVSRSGNPNVQNSHGSKHGRRHSEIPKLDNGLTPSSPPEEVDIIPETTGLLEYAGRYRPNARSDRISKSFAEREAQLSSGFERAPTLHRKGQSVANELAAEAEGPRSHGRKAAPPAAAHKATSPPHNRRERPETDWKSNQGKPSATKTNSPSRPRVGSTKGTNSVLQRSASLNITTRAPSASPRVGPVPAAGPPACRRSTPPSPLVDKDVGPWSTEAVDLFDWRPPGYVFQGQGKGFAPAQSQAQEMPKT